MFRWSRFRFFKDSVFHIFNKHSPIKKKYFRANEAPFMTKELHVAIMKSSRLRNKFLSEKHQANRDNHKSQCNICKKLLRKTKNTYFINLDRKVFTDNRTFCKTDLPLFTTNGQKAKMLLLMRVIKAFLMKKTLSNTYILFF